MRHARILSLALLFAACGSKKSDDKDQPTAKKQPDAGDKGSAAPIKKTPPPPLETLGTDPGSGDGKLGWTVAFGGLGSDVSRDLALLPDGDVVLVGDFEGDAEFGKLGKKSAVPTGADPKKKRAPDDPKPVDGFAMRLKPDGTQTWLTTIGGKNEDVANAVAVQADGTIAVAGLFSHELKAGDLTAKAVGADDLYVAGLDGSGAVKWLFTTGGKASDTANGIAATADGGWIVVGAFVSEVAFGATTVDAVAKDDAYVVKLDAGGAVQWVKTFGGDDEERFVNVAVDVQGSIYAYGLFEGKLTVGKDQLSATGSYDLMLVKLDAYGDPLWAQSFGGLDNEAAGEVAVDKAGNVTFVGSFDQTIKVADQELTANGTADTLVVRLGPDGKVAWVQSWGGKGEDIASTVAADAFGNVIVGGWFEDEVDFGKGAVKSAGNKDAFIAKLAPDGSTTWVRTLGDKDHDKSRAIAISAEGDAFVGGIFRFKLPVEPSVTSVYAPGDKAPQTDGFVIHVDR